jgi:transcriptional regulator with XRE-family HTH domain
MKKEYSWVTEDRQAAFQKLVKDARTQRGLSQAEAAKQAGISQSYIDDLEKGLKTGAQIAPFYQYISWLGWSWCEMGKFLGLEKALDIESTEIQAQATSIAGALNELTREKRSIAISQITQLLNAIK